MKWILPVTLCQYIVVEFQYKQQDIEILKNVGFTIIDNIINWITN